MLAWINKWHLRIDQVMACVSAGLVLVMAVLGTSDVLGRYLFSKPIPGAYELMQFTLGGVALFAFAYVQHNKCHITVSILTRWLPRKAAAVLDIMFLVLMLAVFVLISWQGGRGAIAAWRARDVTIGLIELPIGVAKMVIPIGGGLLCLRLFSQICTGIAKLRAEWKSKGAT